MTEYSEHLAGIFSTVSGTDSVSDLWGNDNMGEEFGSEP
jgi:hypothetical protein